MLSLSTFELVSESQTKRENSVLDYLASPLASVLGTAFHGFLKVTYAKDFARVAHMHERGVFLFIKHRNSSQDTSYHPGLVRIAY